MDMIQKLMSFPEMEMLDSILYWVNQNHGGVLTWEYKVLPAHTWSANHEIDYTKDSLNLILYNDGLEILVSAYNYGVGRQISDMTMEARKEAESVIVRNALMILVKNSVIGLVNMAISLGNNPYYIFSTHKLKSDGDF